MSHFDGNPSVAKKVVEKGIKRSCARAKRREKRAKAVRKGALTGGGLPGKLADCSDRDPANTELYTSSGDSPGGSAKAGTRSQVPGDPSDSWQIESMSKKPGSTRCCRTLKFAP